MRLPIPQSAKKAASRALESRNKLAVSKRYGLDKEQAKRLKIASGVERAKQIKNSSSLSLDDAQAVCRFKRFLPANTPKKRGAVGLWGGAGFIRNACRHVKKVMIK
jgi:hypothetical protein